MTYIESNYDFKIEGGDENQIINMLMDNNKPSDILKQINLSSRDKIIFDNIYRELKYIAKEHRSQHIESKEDLNAKVDEIFKDINVSKKFLLDYEWTSRQELNQY